MFTNLINTIELLSNYKSFKLCVGSTRDHLWLLIHFKHLEILNYNIQYQVNTGVRQRKSTEHPKRWMKKQFSNTAELLAYLSGKSYDVNVIEIEFTNGWKIKEQPQIEFYFYTNSMEERNALIDKLMSVAGLELKDKSVLTPNITYLLKATGEIYPLDDELLPDEFWSEEQLAQWKKDYERINKVYENEQSEGVPFDYLDKDTEFFKDFEFLENENSTPF